MQCKHLKSQCNLRDFSLESDPGITKGKANSKALDDDDDEEGGRSAHDASSTHIYDNIYDDDQCFNGKSASFGGGRRKDAHLNSRDLCSQLGMLLLPHHLNEGIMGYDPSDFPSISQLQRSAVTVTIAYSDSSGNPRLAFRIV